MKSHPNKRSIKLGSARKLTRTGFIGMLPEVENPVLFYNM